MSADLPVELDVWKAVAGRREYVGSLPLAGFTRLIELVESERAGDCRVGYRVGFDRDPLAGPFAELQVEADLPLRCQRTLEVFVLPVRLHQRLGLLIDEDAEAALPEGYEPVLVPASGLIAARDLIEDELILAVPVIPVGPGSAPVEVRFEPKAEEIAAANPFAVLSSLKPKP